MQINNLILGITGNIAAGKSLVAAAFSHKGAALVSADQLAREAVAPGSAALDRLVAHFGQQILNERGGLNREKLGRLVFSDPEARQVLNRITHPAIARLAEERLGTLKSTPGVPLIVYEAPLLFEAGAEGRVDRILVLTVAPDVQLRRLMERDGLSREEAVRRIAAQMPQDEKVARADYLIDNSGAVAQTLEQVEKLWTRLRSADPGCAAGRKRPAR